MGPINEGKNRSNTLHFCLSHTYFVYYNNYILLNFTVTVSSHSKLDCLLLLKYMTNVFYIEAKLWLARSCTEPLQIKWIKRWITVLSTLCWQYSSDIERFKKIIVSFVSRMYYLYSLGTLFFISCKCWFAPTVLQYVIDNETYWSCYYGKER